MTRGRRARLVVLVLLLLGPPAGAARAVTLLPLDLPQLTGRADRIFVGRVETVATGRDANGVPAVWTTFTVEQPLKGWTGSAPDHVTLKQLGASFGGAAAPVVPNAMLPRYREGEAVVLFVHADSALGFTSPVGFGQGCFRIDERDGARTVENDVGNANLAPAATAHTLPSTSGRALATGAASAGPVPLATFVARVQALAAAP